MRTLAQVAVVVILTAIVFKAERAWALFHLVVIDQVFFGTAECPNAQYVMMRMLGADQSSIRGQSVRTQNADGSDAGDFGTFTSLNFHGQPLG